MSAPPDLGPVLDLVDDAIVLLRCRDPDQPAPVLVWTNQAFRRLTGHDAPALQGRGIRVLRAAPMPAAAFARLTAAVAAGRDFDGSILLSTSEGGAQAAFARGTAHPADATLYVLRLVADDGAGLAGEARIDLVAGLRCIAFYTLAVRPDGALVAESFDPALEVLAGSGDATAIADGGLLRLILPADQAELQRRNQALLAGRAAVVDYRIRLPDGRLRWLRDSARPQLSAFGDVVVRAIGAITDVTSEHQADDQHRWRERVAGLLAHVLHALVLVVDADGRVLWASVEPVTPLADSFRRAVGASLEVALNGREADLWMGWIDRCLAGRERQDFRLVWSRGADSATAEVMLVPLGEDAALAIVRTHDPAVAPGRLLPPDPAQPPIIGALLATLAEPALLLDPDLLVREASPRAADALGTTAEALRGRSFVELPGIDDDGDSVQARLALLLRERRGGELQLPGLARTLGNRLAVTPLLDAGGAAQGLLVARHRPAPAGQPESWRGASWLATLIDSVADGVLGLDGDGRVESFSRAAQDIFGVERSAAVGRPIEQLLTAGPGIQPSLRQLLDAHAAEPGDLLELFARRPSGEVVPVEVTVMPMALEVGRLLLLVVRDMTERRQTEETLRSLAYIDPLTALPNRLLFHDRLTQAIERARRLRQMLAVMLVDLDRFKLVNDSLGLEKGDQMLRAVGERLAAALRRSDTIARLGGDEFLVLAPGVGNAEAAAKVAQKLLDALRPGFAINGHELSTGASIGIALYPYDGDDADALVKNADTALSQAKQQGRNHYQFYTNDMNATAFERLMLESRLRKALPQEELAVYYQPQVSLETGEVVGVEALLRWFHPDLGMVPPSEFIPLAEDTGLIIPIGAWALRAACRDVMGWHEQGFSGMRLAVNVSGRQFEQRDLADGLAEVLAETGFPPGLLELELTESVIMRHASDAVRRLRELTGLGVQLAVDDFGTGYSSLSYLRTFPIRSLKIDRSFVRDIDRDPNGRVIPQAVIALAGSLELKVVAEGVETEAQLAFLRAAGCQEMQGYLFARPLPPDDVLALLRSGRRLALD